MSDAGSDLLQDKRLAETFNDLSERTEAFLKNKDADTGRKQGLALISDWANYAHMRRGYYDSPFVGSARSAIAKIGHHLEGKALDDPRNYPLPQLEPDSARHWAYFAVQGHGTLMGANLEEVVGDALRRKFGKNIPHSFSIVVNKEGTLDFEKRTCETCPYSYGCSMKDKCNCYVREEYESQQAKHAAEKKYVKNLLERLKLRSSKF